MGAMTRPMGGAVGNPSNSLWSQISGQMAGAQQSPQQTPQQMPQQNIQQWGGQWNQPGSRFGYDVYGLLNELAQQPFFQGGQQQQLQQQQFLPPPLRPAIFNPNAGIQKSTQQQIDEAVRAAVSEQTPRSYDFDSD